MKKYNKFIYIFLVFVELSCQVIKIPQIFKPVSKTSAPTTTQPKPVESTVPATPAPEPIALTVGATTLKTSDLKLEFEKKLEDDTISFSNFLTEVITTQRLVAEAKQRGYDKAPEYNEELDSYRSLLAESYLTDSTTIKSLIKETYDWMKEEVHIAHIMYQVPEFAEPSDTLAIYQKLIGVRNKILAGGDFSSFAEQISQDKKTNTQGGDLGWFRAIRFHYPIEKIAYTLPVGQISLPVRTKGGYHLIKVLDRRPFSGTVIVQHIFKALAPTAPDSVSNTVKTNLTQLQQSINNQVISFEDACKQYSEDNKTRNAGGYLPPFSVGSREEVAFVDAAFALQIGQVSPPVRTSSGWHLIKLAKKLPLESFEEVSSKLKEKVVTDSRGDLVKDNTIIRLKKQLGFVEDEATIKNVFALPDTSLLTKHWHYGANNPLLTQSLFKINSKPYLVKDFLDYVVERQRLDRFSTGYTPSMMMRGFYKKYTDNAIKTYAEKHLSEINPEFNILMKDYAASLLKVDLMNDLVYEKSVSDTTGQRTYYEQNKNKFMMPERVFATIITSKDSRNIQLVKDILQKGKPYNIKRMYRSPLNFLKYNSDLTDEHMKILVAILDIMRKNRGYVVEIGGHADLGEPDNVSAERIEKAKAFLVKNGLELERIIENDYGKTKPADKFDWTKNQRVSFIFYSNSKKDIEKLFNTKELTTVSINEGYFKRGDNKFIDAVSWEVRPQSTIQDGEIAEIIIEKIEPPRPKTLNECRGQVIAEYQKMLEEKLKADLAYKYPAKADKEEIQKILEKKTVD